MAGVTSPASRPRGTGCCPPQGWLMPETPSQEGHRSSQWPSECPWAVLLGCVSVEMWERNLAGSNVT